MKHETDVITHEDSSQGECTCGWTGDRVVNTYAAQQQGRDHLRDTRARPASRPRRGGKNTAVKYDKGGELPQTGPQQRSLADLIGPGRLEGIIAEQRHTAQLIRDQKKDPK